MEAGLEGEGAVEGEGGRGGGKLGGDGGVGLREARPHILQRAAEGQANEPFWPHGTVRIVQGACVRGHEHDCAGVPVSWADEGARLYGERAMIA